MTRSALKKPAVSFNMIKVYSAVRCRLDSKMKPSLWKLGKHSWMERVEQPPPPLPYPVLLSPLLYIQLQRIDFFFPPFTLMDNTHPFAERRPRMYAHTQRDATAWALNIITLTSPQPSVMRKYASCWDYSNTPHKQRAHIHTPLDLLILMQTGDRNRCSIDSICF